MKEQSDPEYEVASPPAELLSAAVGTEHTMLKLEKRFDGFLGFGSTLDFVQPDEPFPFKRVLEITQKRSRNFKGITELSMFPEILEISFGFMENLELSLLLCSTNDTRPVYKDVIAEVQRLVNASCLCCSAASRTIRNFKATGGDNRLIYPQDWAKFSEAMSRGLTKSFGNVDTFSLQEQNPLIPAQIQEHSASFRCYFSVRRMGQDLLLNDDMSYRNWCDIARNYFVLNVKSPSLLSVVVHVATDAFPENGKFPMWDFVGVRNALGTSAKTFNVFFLSGIGNMVYDFTCLENESNIKFIQLYSRLAHQLHRNNTTCFKEVCASNKLAGAFGLMFKKTGAITECNKYTRALTGLLKIYDVVDCIIDQVELPTAARCEVVTEFRCLFNDGSEYVPKATSVATMLNVAFSSTNTYINLKEVVTPKHLVFLSQPALKYWLEQTIVPCRTTLRNSTRSMLKVLNLMLSETKEKFKHFQHLDFNTTNFLDVLVSEAIITMFTRGELSKKWPIYLSRTLGLESIKWSNRGSVCPIRHVKFTRDKIDCQGLAATNISSYLPVWIGINKLETFGEMLTHFTYLKSLKSNSSISERKHAVEALCQEFMFLLYASAMEESEVSCGESINLVDMKNSVVTKTLNKIVLSPSEFLVRLSSKGFHPAVLTTLYNSISSTVRSKFRDEDFSKWMTSKICNAVFDHGIALYVPLNKATAAAVVPNKNYVEKMTEIYAEVFTWTAGRSTGLREINCSEVFRKTLPTFIGRGTKAAVPVQSYLKAVNFWLDHDSVERLKRHVSPTNFGLSLLNAFVTV